MTRCVNCKYFDASAGQVDSPDLGSCNQQPPIILATNNVLRSTRPGVKKTDVSCSLFVEREWVLKRASAFGFGAVDDAG